jgi:poly(A) polymerase
MIRKLLRSVFSKNTHPLIIPFRTHGISREQISSCASNITKVLQEKGYAAFIVGGAVRDLLVGKHPKDFDIATDASPEEIKALFRRSRIIGRRFKLVHVMCGNDIVEVSTFRGSHIETDEENGNTDEHGRILRDNVFGTQEQDAKRRDFTINALFYDPQTQEIWDYLNGYADLQQRRLRMIGKPELRFREDPVRMLRAVRLAATLELAIDVGTRGGRGGAFT